MILGMDYMTQEIPLWNTSNPPKYSEIPLRRIKLLLQQDQIQQAILEYCQVTGAGLIEAQFVVDEIKKGIGLHNANRYIGWRTGGEIIFWCKKCACIYKRGQIRKIMRDGDWGSYLVYECMVCNEATAEFHDDQAKKVFNQLWDTINTSDNRASSNEMYRKAYLRAEQDFKDESFSPEVALEYETGLTNGQTLLNFLQEHGYLSKNQDV